MNKKHKYLSWLLPCQEQGLYSFQSPVSPGKLRHKSKYQEAGTFPEWLRKGQMQ